MLRKNFPNRVKARRADALDRLKVKLKEYKKLLPTLDGEAATRLSEKITRLTTDKTRLEKKIAYS